ncbi:RNA pseudouridylate synthase domain-containing protein 2 [Holothuria leucospilota]|uniref:Pseudouridylate synthase RPUSD2 n=1 Tax=Holothuria leucospilota TaxID=206669 RepID=A0A9Q1CBJ2_HOLLE|nr:RNA pseudouridylate synthase domain-containing protein 2 [Holothuria leucospilota]
MLFIQRICQLSPASQLGKLLTRMSYQNMASSLSDCSCDSQQSIQQPTMPANVNKRKQLLKQGKNHPKKMFKSSYETRFGETDYYFDGGFRRVKPYVYAFECHAKGRWFGRKILDIFKKEFRLETAEFYAKAIETGLIKVNGKMISPDYIVKNNDFLHSRVHRHEPPVTSDPIDIITSTDEFVVINKPSSIPVHPCGKYRHNTVVFLLAKEHNLIKLHTIHRLDRLTSGLLIFARTKAASQKIDAYVRERKVKKTYICKVVGEFPSHTVECNEPIFIVSYKIGVCRVQAGGKECKTTFQRVSYDGETSIVKCFPETGRMHQIRVHLQYLGHPIQNDPLYNNTVWGTDKGRGGCPDLSDEVLLKRLVDQHDEEKTVKINEYRNENAGMNDNCDVIGDDIKQTATPVDSTISRRVTKNGIAQTSPKSEEHVRMECNLSEDPVLHKKNLETGIAQCQDEISSEKISNSTVESLSCSQSGSQNLQISSSDLFTTSHSVSSDERKDDCQSSQSSNQGSVSVLDQGDGDEIRSPELTTMEGTLEGIGTIEVDETKLRKLTEEGTEGAVDEIAKMLCRECVTPLPDPKPSEMKMYLHALTYKGPDFEFSTPMPDWALHHSNISASL